MGRGQRDPHGRPRALIISHTDGCLQPEPQLARRARKVPGAPSEPPIAGSQPRAQSPPTGNIPGPPLPASLPPCLPQSLPPAAAWAPFGRNFLPSAGELCAFRGPPKFCARSGKKLGPRDGQPWAGVASCSSRFRERLSNSRPLCGATWAAPRSLRVASRQAGGVATAR